MKHLCSVMLAALAVLSFSCQQPQPTVTVDYTKYVNPFIGAAENGHTFPGACCPFGMIQTSPVTGAVGWIYCSEYVYSDSIIWGFSQTHLNGTGCMDLGDLLVMPVSGEQERSWDGYRSSFRKETESASPGYYAVTLDDAGVKAELTSTIHAALHRYTFEKEGTAGVLIDLQHGPSWNENQYHSHVRECEVTQEDATTFTGHVNNSVWVNQDYYFILQTSRPVASVIELPQGETEKGKRLVATFDGVNPGEEVLVKLALSTTGVEGAKKNLAAELQGWDFDAVRKQASDEWNSYLSRIEVEGTDDQKVSFYTSLYHALIQPNEISDVDGMYRNAANEVVAAEGGKFYSTFSAWDTYRAAHPFYTIVTPERVDGLVSSLVSQGEVQGFLPIWALWGKENYCMVANHSVSIVAEAYAKGFRGFDAERAFQTIKNTQTVSHKLKSDWETYMKYGYFPTDLIKTESVSSTLESVYDDYAAADMARRMGKTEDAEYFSKRADFYKNLFCPETKFMRPRKSNGEWKSPFNPSMVGHSESVGGDYTEGNAWQYTWHVQHDIPGLIELMGGAEPFIEKLNTFFTLKLETEQADVTGLIGQYAHGNEPSHHVAYLYTMAGAPDRTAELVRQIFDTQYLPEPNGLCGNDDCGQMSAWYMLSAMGFYPVDPVSCKYVFGAPQMPKIVVHLAGGKTLTIIADGISEDCKYVESITLNGEPITESYITHEQIMNGGTLVYKMRS